ncbi:MAG: hypothetical protein ACI3XR_05955, partial [Eubacteriales bacterium]
LPIIMASLDTVVKYLPKPYVQMDESYSRLFAQSRQTEDGVYTVIMNMDRDKTYSGVTVKFPKTGLIEKWDLQTGEVSSLTYGDTVTDDFAPNGEICLLLKDSPNTSCPTADEPSPEAVIPQGPFAYELSEPNICVLDMAEYQVNGQRYEKEDVILADRRIRRTLGLPLRGGEMIQPWYAARTEQPIVGNIVLRFSFRISDMPSKLYLAMETPEAFSISVNGHKDAVHMTTRRWVDRCFAVLEIAPESCIIGENVIELEAGMRNNLNLEALYLLGDFGVQLDGTVSNITKRPATLKVGDITDQGFPFYSGGITYILPVNPDVQNLSLDDYDAALIKVKGNGKERLLYAAPYLLSVNDLVEDGTLKLEYILTRRNTFGPLHYKPLRAGGYGPFLYTEEREDLLLRHSYGLLPQGMTSKVSLLYPKQGEKSGK